MTRAQVIAAYRKAAELARAEGVTVRFRTGWTTRGSIGLNPRCIVEHDTSDPARLSPSRMLAILDDGHGALTGNAICNDAILTDGTVWVIASGIAWHAGTSSWDGIATLNTNGLGTEYQRFQGDALTSRQLEVGRIWTRARCAAFGIPARRVCEHFECALPSGRKVDRSVRPGVRQSGPTWRTSLTTTTTPPASQEDDMPYRDWPQADKDALLADVRRIIWGGLPDADNRWPDPTDGTPRNMATYARRTRIIERDVADLPGKVADAVASRLPSGQGGGVSAAELRDIVRAELARLKISNS